MATWRVKQRCVGLAAEPASSAMSARLSPAPEDHLANLDMIRAFAAMSVCLSIFHAMAFWAPAG